MRFASKAMLVIAIAVAPSCSFAQSAAIFNRQENTDLIIATGGPQQSNARSTSATGSRLIAQAYRAYIAPSYVLKDSVTLSYTGTRGGYRTGMQWTWLYDDRTALRYNGSTFSNNTRTLQAYDMNNNIISSTGQRWDTATMSWASEYVYLLTYDGMNNRIAAKAVQWNPATSTWDTTDRITDAYDAANNMISEIQEQWNTSSMAWENRGKSTYTYDAANNRISQLYWQWSGGWFNTARLTYTYDAMNNKLTELSEAVDSTGTWINGSRYLFSNFVAQQPQVQILQQWNGTAFINKDKADFTFNSYDQPDHYYTQQWDTTTGTWQSTIYSSYINYYYGTYTTDTKVLNTADANVSVYPIPTTNEVTIDINWTTPQAFSVTLIDITGRIYVKQSVSACTQYKDKISTADVPAGNYIINIESATGKTTKKISVLK